MAASGAVLTSTPMPLRQRTHPTNVVPPMPSSSSSRAPPDPPPLIHDASPRAFSRFRSSLEQSLRTAARMRKTPTPTPDADDDDFAATITAKDVKDKAKAKVITVEEEEEDVPKEKDRMNVFRKLESKVTFRRAPRESLAATSQPPPKDILPKNERQAGYMSYMTPSLRQASISSPALHLSSQALPSPKSQPSVPVSSSSSNAAAVLASPTTRGRVRRASLQPPSADMVSAPTPLAPRRDRQGQAPTAAARHRSVKSNPPDYSAPSPLSPAPHRSSLDTHSTPRSSSDLPSPPDTPTPSPRGQVHRSSSSIRPVHGQSHHRSTSPTPSRTVSPIRARSPPHGRVVTPTSNRGLKSSSAVQLPLSSSPPPPPPARRPSIDGTPRRPSIDSPRRVSGEIKRVSPHDARPDSPPPPVRLRTTSPTQRSYAQNRHYGISSSSLIAPPSPSSPSSKILSSPTTLSSNVENREQLRKAAGMLCREMARPPPHMAKSEQGVRDWEEVELRLRPLARLERIWGMSGSGILGNRSRSGSVSGSGSGSSSSGISTVGEERERKVFCEALRDGYVLCQLMNKLRSSSVVRPDAREDGFVKTSNVTRFLAACASYGLAHEDLFQRDDLIVASGESLARVAHTIIALIQFVETPAPSRIIRFNNNNSNTKPGQSEQGPYMKGSLGRAAASTPNLLPPLSTSPIPVARKRYSPPSGLPPLRSDSSEEGHQTPVRAMTPKGKNVKSKYINDDDNNDVFYDDDEDDDDYDNGNHVEVKELPPPPTLRPAPPPKSPLRARSPRPHQRRKDSDGGLGAWARKAASPIKSRTDSMAESTRASIGNASFLDASNDESYALLLARQSVASSAVTDTTVTTQVSSILDHHPSGGGGSGYNNKFGTIRTVTTDLTSEMPSVTRTEGSAMVDELVVKSGGAGAGASNGGRKGKEKTPSAAVLFASPSSPSSSSSCAMQKLGRERRVSGAHGVDLTRVAEEPDESGSSSRGGGDMDRGRRSIEGGEDGPRVKGGRTTTRTNQASRERQSTTGADKVHAVHLHKAKWPDDFMDAFQMPIRNSSPSRLNALGLDPSEVLSSSSSNDASSAAATTTTKSGSYVPLSISPPRKIAIVGRSNDGNGGGGNGGGTSLAPRRPTHVPRHCADAAPVLLPRESILRREASPEGGGVPSRVMLRRHSTTKTVLPPRTSSSLSRHTPEGHRDSEENESPAPTPVPFPRSVSGSGERSGSPGSPSKRAEANVQGGGTSAVNEKPRLVRGRFQSEINESSTRRKQAPDSHDESGDRPLRTRFESMVNLGGSALGMSASDLMARNSIDGGAVRKTIVVREEGKPPTHFQLGDRIGRGQFGTVYRALNLNTGQMVAVKRIGLEGLKEDEISTLMKEVDLLKSLSHPSIVKYEGMVRDDDTLSIVLEYAENGSLAHTIKAFGKLNERLVASYVVKILEGLHYLHQSDVVHCDMKAANILTTKNGNVKLSDFGVSLNLRAMERQNDVAGTPNWMAPEVIELKGASPKSDIWSLGCTVVELLTGHPPYADITNSMSVMFRIVEDDTPPIPEGCSDLLQEFLEQCFHKDPSMRPSAELLCEHPWLKKNWVALKDLRPQDSIPFLRRVSADMQKVDLTNVLRAQSPTSPTKTETPPPSASSPTPSGRPFEGEFSPREHSFVKTTFSKPVVCRVCLQNVKKTAVLCAKCSLISHSKCASSAPPTCDLRSQLLLYAHYAETGNPMTAYANPLDSHHDIPLIPTASSDIPFASNITPRSSMDTIPPGPVSNQLSTGSQAPHPPTAFKLKAVFKRSRSNLNADRGDHSNAPSPAPPPPKPDKMPTKEDKRAEAPDERPSMVHKRPSVLHKRHKDRPKSYSSTSTDPSVSLRSAVTAAESHTSHNNNSNGLHERRQSQFSVTDTERHTRFSAGDASLYSDEDGRRKTPRVMEMSAAESEATADFVELSTSSIFPGGMPSDPPTADRRRNKRRESKQSGNCNVQ